MDIAAYGWEHPEWTGVFYPEDLPAEWRLDFYCNEFRAVVVPAALWAGGEGAEGEAWSSGLGEQTRVYLEFPSGVFAPRVRPVREALGDRLAGFVAAAPPSPPAPGIGWCWPGQGGVPQCSGEGLATAWIGPEPVTPMALRQIIEALAAAGGHNNALLVVRGGPASLGLMRDAQVVAGLLGL